MTAIRVVSEIASEMGLVPLAWLVVLRFRGMPRDAALWWLAVAFGVSWLADLIAFFVDPWLTSATYPATQAALIGAVFLSRRDAMRFLVLLVAVAVFAIAMQGATGPEIVSRAVAFGSACVIAYRRPEVPKLRAPLLVYFGLGLVAWAAVVYWSGTPNDPRYTPYLVYQAIRAVGIGLFCWAALDPKPPLRKVA
jgi:hypothetical protein